MSEPREKVHIGSARDLFEALGSPEAGVRLSVLQAIAEYPEQALAYGPWEGEDLIGRLIHLARRDPMPMVRSVMVKVVANFRSKRVLEFLQERMQATQDVDLVLELEPRFGVEPLSEVRDFLLGFIDEPAKWPAQALVAARLLSADESLSPARRLRVALLSDRDAPLPALDAETVEAWTAELNGDLADRAQALVGGQGDALLRLWQNWESLSDPARVWLLECTAAAHADTARAAVPALLDGSLSAEVACALLHCAMVVGVDLDAMRPERVMELLEHRDSRVRAAAIEAGLGDSQLVVTCMSDPAQEWHVRVACVRRWMRAHPEGALEPLLGLLADADWRIRAAAAEALVSLGDAAADRVLPMVTSGPEAQRMAAARVLATLRGEEWLERELAALQAH